MKKTIPTFIEVTVTPKSSKSLISVENGEIRAKLHSPPLDGKANGECVALLAKTLGLPKSAVGVARGEKSRRKLFSIDGLSPEEVMERLSAPKNTP
jgi:uncharacterized protein (TIGR00251 family)